MRTQYGEEVTVLNYPITLCVQCQSFSKKMKYIWLTPSEALELAAELVKLAMPDAKPDIAPVSIM